MRRVSGAMLSSGHRDSERKSLTSRSSLLGLDVSCLDCLTAVSNSGLSVTAILRSGCGMGDGGKGFDNDGCAW